MAARVSEWRIQSRSNRNKKQELQKLAYRHLISSLAVRLPAADGCWPARVFLLSVRAYLPRLSQLVRSLANVDVILLPLLTPRIRCRTSVVAKANKGAPKSRFGESTAPLALAQLRVISQVNGQAAIAARKCFCSFSCFQCLDEKLSVALRSLLRVAQVCRKPRPDHCGRLEKTGLAKDFF